MPNIRIHDVASHAGVSLATITRVINNRGYVAPETRERVQKSIKTLGYIPNRMAKALRNRKTGIIGNVLPLTLDNLVFSKISHSLRVAAAGHGLQVLPIFCDSRKDQEEQLIQELIGHLVEGIIFNSIISASRRTIREVLNKKIPVVMLERSPDAKGVDKVAWDNIAGSEIAASHFIARGHRSLSFIGCQFGPTPDDEERFMGFKQGLERMGIILKKHNIQLVPNYGIEQGYKAMKAIIEQSGANRPTGCYITADTLLCGALQYLYEAGVQIPKDVSIISHDNTLSAMCGPPITAVAIPFEELGQTAISMFWERREQNRTVDKSVKLSPFLVDRNSVAKIRER